MLPLSGGRTTAYLLPGATPSSTPRLLLSSSFLGAAPTSRFRLLYAPPTKAISLLLSYSYSLLSLPMCHRGLPGPAATSPLLLRPGPLPPQLSADAREAARRSVEGVLCCLGAPPSSPRRNVVSVLTDGVSHGHSNGGERVPPTKANPGRHRASEEEGTDFLQLFSINM